MIVCRPVNCPHSNCHKSVAISAFDAHFTHEHPKVQVIHTYLESRNGMEIYLDRISYSNKICIVRLNVLESGDTGNKYDKTLFFFCKNNQQKSFLLGYIMKQKVV